MKLLNAVQVLGSNDLRFKDVSCPEFAPEVDEAGVELTSEQKAEYAVRIRNLTAEGRGVFIQHSTNQDELKKANAEKAAKGEPFEKPKFVIEALLVAMTAVDDTGALMFNEDQVLELNRKSAAAIARCSEAAQELSGLRPQDKDTAVKN